MNLRFPTAIAMNRLNRELRLPAAGTEQDWEIELADSTRLDDFRAYYFSARLDDDERFALLCLIVASAQDRLTTEGPGPWLDEVLSMLRKRADLAGPIADNWCRAGNDWEIASHLQTLSQQEAH